MALRVLSGQAAWKPLRGTIVDHHSWVLTRHHETIQEKPICTPGKSIVVGGLKAANGGPITSMTA
jgi:hypothetical protein